MTTVITGATGVVGGAVLRHLVTEGGSIRALVRPGRELNRLGGELAATVAPAVESGQIKTVAGDVLDSDSLLKAFDGADLVYHVAGVNKLCLPDPTSMYRTNVEGTRNVLQSARATGVRRIVYTSSAATIGEVEGEVGTEDSARRQHFHSHYERSKYEAEQVVLNEAGDLYVVIVNPSSVQGPGRSSGSGKLLLDLVAGRLRTVVDTRISIVDINDCARGHLLAAAKGVHLRRYVLNSFSMTIQEALSVMEVVTKRALKVRYLPAWVAKAAGGVIGPIFSVIGRTAPICLEMARTLVHGHVYDGSRATRELGLVYTEATDTLTHLIDWARSEGILDPNPP